jgi:hypothetical protein
MKTHTLTPALNAAIDAFRNACWRQRPILPARAALENAIREDVARQVSEIVDRLTPPPATDVEMAQWLGESIEAAVANADIDRRILEREPDRSPDDLAYWVAQARMFRDIANRLGIAPIMPERAL